MAAAAIALGLMAAPVAAPVAQEEMSGTLELKRFVVPGVGRDSSADVVFSFTALLQFDAADRASAEVYTPYYRDVVISTTIGYRTFTDLNGRPFLPEDLQLLLMRRLGGGEGAPKPQSVVLQSFIVKPLQPRG